LTQAALGKKVGLEAVAISRIENGDPLSAVDDAKVDALFKTLGLSAGSPQANFVKWWRVNGWA